jgi:hypothetical protein
MQVVWHENQYSVTGHWTYRPVNTRRRRLSSISAALVAQRAAVAVGNNSPTAGTVGLVCCWEIILLYLQLAIVERMAALLTLVAQPDMALLALEGPKFQSALELRSLLA